MKFTILVFLCLIFSNCSLFDNKVNMRLIGEVSFPGNKTRSGTYWKIKTFDQLINSCTEQGYSYEEFSNKCISTKELSSEEEMRKILIEYDVVASVKPISGILKNTEYTRKDGCDYLTEKVVEVITEDETKSLESMIFLYKIPKGKYRFNLCP